MHSAPAPMCPSGSPPHRTSTCASLSAPVRGRVCRYGTCTRVRLYRVGPSYRTTSWEAWLGFSRVCLPHWRFAPLSGLFVRAVVRLCGCLFVCARRPPTRESGRTRLHHSLRRSQASTASLRREAKARKPTLEPFGAPQAYPSVPFSRCTLDALASTHETAALHTPYTCKA